MNGRRLLGVALGIVLLALLLRGWQGASRGGVWRDEANAWFVVRQSATPGELFDNLRVESTPPLQPLLEYALQRAVGKDPKWLRSVAVLFGTLTVAGIIALGWRLHPSCGLLAGMIAATSPYFIRIAGEMRSYALFGMLAVVHAAAYLRYLERRGLRDACLWGASAALLAYAHYYAFPVVFCAGIAALAARRARVDLAHVAAAGATFLLLYAPWIPGFLHQLRSDLQPWYPPETTTTGLLYVLKLPLGLHGGILLVLSLLAGAWIFRPRPSPPDPLRLRFWGLFAIGVAPAALAWVLQVYAGAFEGRYLVAMAVPALPVACFGWSRLFRAGPARLAWPRVELGGETLRGFAWALLAGAILVQHVDTARWLRKSSPARELAALVSRHARPDDLVWIFPAPYASSFNFYFQGPQPQLAFPFRGRVTKIDWPALRDREQDPQVIDAFLSELGRHLDRRRRVWALFVEGLPMESHWSFAEGPAEKTYSRLARAEMHVHRRALRLLYSRARVAGWWDRPHRDYHEGMTLVLFEPQG